MGGRGANYYEKRNREKEQELVKKLVKQSKNEQPYPDDPESERDYYDEFKKLKNQGFSVRKSTDEFDVEYLKPYQKQLIKLNEKYNPKDLIKENDIQLSSYRLNGAYGAMQGVFDDRNKLQIRLVLNKKTLKEKENYIKSKMYGIAKGDSVFVETKNIYLYTITHEFGHIVEENIIRKRYKQRAEHLGINYEKFREMEAERIKNEVIRNLQNKYTMPLKDDMIYLSKYSKDKYKFADGTGNDLEWFAETFTHSQLSANPEPIAKELENYIRRNNNA